MVLAVPALWAGRLAVVLLLPSCHLAVKQACWQWLLPLPLLLPCPLPWEGDLVGADPRPALWMPCFALLQSLPGEGEGAGAGRHHQKHPHWLQQQVRRGAGEAEGAGPSLLPLAPQAPHQARLAPSCPCLRLCLVRIAPRMSLAGPDSPS